MVDPAAVRKTYTDYLSIHATFKNRMVLDEPFPFERFRVYEDRLPKHMCLLLLAESPPWNDPANYFYNPDFDGKLSTDVFNLLHIQGASKEKKLSDFKERRKCFLIDTVMCIYIKKNGKGRPLGTLIDWSAKNILQDEIVNVLKPKCILVLGGTALRGIAQIKPFNTKLSMDMSPIDECGKTFEFNDMAVVVSAFPNDRNRGHWKKITQAFDTALKLADDQCKRSQKKP